VVFYTSLTVITVFFELSFRPFNLETSPWFLINEEEGHYLFPSENKKITSIRTSFYRNFFVGFREAIGYRESESKYKKINSLGYLGKYQFGIETLKSVG
jgi:hypothetical protein